MLEMRPERGTPRRLRVPIPQRAAFHTLGLAGDLDGDGRAEWAIAFDEWGGPGAACAGSVWIVGFEP